MDSASAAMRLQTHALAEPFDLVILEYAINDLWLDPTIRRQTYEGCLRQILKLPDSALVMLCLTERDEHGPGMAKEQSILADYYHVPWVHWCDSTVAQRQICYESNDNLHPNNLGHKSIAELLIDYCQRSYQSAGPIINQAATIRLPDPLYSRDFAYTALLDSSNCPVIANRGFMQGSDQQESWVSLGGAPSGWHANQDDAEIVLEVQGKTIGLLISESEHYRNMEAWIDESTERVTLVGAVPYRIGYLGWCFLVVGRGLSDGPHKLHVRVRNDEHQGSNKSVQLCGIYTAGLHPSGQFNVCSFLSNIYSPQQPGWRITGRIASGATEAVGICWQETSLELRFIGDFYGIMFEAATDRNWFEIVLDDQSHLIFIPESSTPTYWRFDGSLGGGEHFFRLRKRSEGFFGNCWFAGISLANSVEILPPSPRRPLLAIYGDSISAGACVEDGQIDQYDTLSTHDSYLAYGCIAARRLGFDLVNFSVSGTGITASWNPIFLPAVFAALQPQVDSVSCTMDCPDGTQPDYVVCNLGQNDFGFPNFHGNTISANYGPGLLQFLHDLRQRYPKAWIIGALGGMEAPILCPELLKQFQTTCNEFGCNDQLFSSLVFKAFSAAHPRFDIQAQLADELYDHIAQLRKEKP
jgi:lysophospholipase L1-like esterase